jgi:hypothetical protein
MKINPSSITKNVWYNDRTGMWNWVLIVEDAETKDTEMHSGNALDKTQAKHDIMKTLTWLQTH